MYKLDKGLVDLINAQRAEAEEFSKQPGCFMGMMPKATDLVYWESRVPSGTLKEYERIELEETTYYMAADAMKQPDCLLNSSASARWALIRSTKPFSNLYIFSSSFHFIDILYTIF